MIKAPHLILVEHKSNHINISVFIIYPVQLFANM